jgi:hypothetical protein
MKIILTTTQLRDILARPDIKPKYPITINMKNVSKEDFADLVRLLKKKA